MILQPGNTIGRFTIRELVDKGPVVNVYKAFDATHGRFVAIEVPTDLSAAASQRLIREAKLVAQLKHPNVIDVYEASTVDGLPCIVAEYIDGMGLREHLMQHRDSFPQIVDLLTQVADGLQAAHDQQVVHRDLKPSNILVTDAHQIKILDFGLTPVMQRQGIALSAPAGSFTYLAPEQLRGESIGAQSDVYSMGVVAYEALTGRQPFAGHSPAATARAVLEESPAPPVGVPTDLQSIILQMLSKRPYDRPSAREVARELRSIESPIIIHRTPPTTESFQIQFPDAETYYAALAAEAQTLTPTVASERRQFFSVDINTKEGLRQLQVLEERYGANIVEDYQYAMDYRVFDQDASAPEGTSPATLDDVMRRINAYDAWQVSRGASITIAMVDTGIEGSRSEFSNERRVGAWQANGDNAWTDSDGHGTMCATIAVASGGPCTGVAPDAGIISCKVNFKDSQLALAYDYLTDLARTGMRIVASNSWGIYTGTAPAPRPKAQFPSALANAIDAGIFVVCSAGNYHDLTSGTPAECSPTSIWLHKSRADLLTVATCKLDGQMWFYSSRGPGQHFGDENTSRKPDVTAPTPERGLILYGNTPRLLADGWGTSGAAPQVAGLAALLLARAPGISRAELQAIIRDTAEPLTWARECCGAGMINCTAALKKLSESF